MNPIRHLWPLSSTWRFALECLPIFLVLAKMGRDQRFDRVYLAVALGLQGIMIVTFSARPLRRLTHLPQPGALPTHIPRGKPSWNVRLGW